MGSLSRTHLTSTRTKNTPKTHLSIAFAMEGIYPVCDRELSPRASMIQIHSPLPPAHNQPTAMATTTASDSYPYPYSTLKPEPIPLRRASLGCNQTVKSISPVSSERSSSICSISVKDIWKSSAPLSSPRLPHNSQLPTPQDALSSLTPRFGHTTRTEPSAALDITNIPSSSPARSSFRDQRAYHSSFQTPRRLF